MMRFVAPAGAPIEISKILRATAAAIFSHPTGEGSLQSLAAPLNARHWFGVASGRSALALILRGLSRLRPDRSVVALPAYTCFTVPAAVIRAKLKVHPVEINPETLDFNFSDLERLPGDRVLGIVSSNLFGLPNDGTCIRAAARARGAFFIDDAAQAMGASRNGSLAGMMGDVGFYSFGRGKALAAVEGGLIVTNSDEIAGVIREEANKLPSSTIFHTGWVLFQMLVYSVFLHPRLYWFPNLLPFLNLGTTEFDPEFREFRMPAVVRELLAKTRDGLEKIIEIRRRNAAALSEGLGGNPLFAAPRRSDSSVPSSMRFHLIARDEPTRDRAVQALQAVGIGATPFYPSAVCDIEGIGRYMDVKDFHRPAAEDLARRLLTLPTHPYVQRSDVQIMVEVLYRL